MRDIMPDTSAFPGILKLFIGHDAALVNVIFTAAR